MHLERALNPLLSLCSSSSNSTSCTLLCCCSVANSLEISAITEKINRPLLLFTTVQEVNVGKGDDKEEVRNEQRGGGRRAAGRDSR